MTTRTRLTLTTLESREVCATLLQVSAISQITNLLASGQYRTLTPAARPETKDPGPADKGVLADGPDKGEAATVRAAFTVRNTTGRPMTVAVRWYGSAAPEVYVLRAGEAHTFQTVLPAG